MNAFWAVIPIILIRYVPLRFINKESLSRAGTYAPLIGREKIAYWIYQITTALMLLSLLLLKIKTDSYLFFIGLILYISGIILYALSVISFAKPNNNGLNLNGLYKISRNPMYVSYFISFLGCVFLTRSYILLILLIIFQISAHFIILSEERWCIQKFNDEYMQYMRRVRRYF
ncbi:MAG: phospholipid methyltransferase [Eubacteriaceae bacterium]|nr:phospholipid methyltransferase [Eubacteriaceae bacterium]